MTGKRFFVYPKCLVAALAVLSLSAAPAAVAAVGDAYTYRVTDRYTNEARGDITYQVDKIDGNRVMASVSSQNSLVEAGRTAIFTSEGNWVRHAIDSHGFPQTIEFSADSPAYAFPLAVGKRWSMRAPARVAQTGQTRSVRIDAQVVGAERIRVPAGEFDTLKIHRIIYGGDGNGFESETRISQTEWYAPALKRAVKTEVNSSHLDMRIGRGNRVVRGGWDLHELVEVRPAETRIQ
jgi:hypothetical protein